MAIGGVRGPGNFGNTNGNQGHAAEKSGAEEFNLEKQSTSAKGEQASSAALTRYDKKGRVAKLVDKKKRNRRGSPRTVLVDGEIYEVYLLAIA